MSTPDLSAERLAGMSQREVVIELRTWLAILVGTMTLATFATALLNGFVTFDDGENFLRNPHYRGLGWEQLRWMFTSTHMGQYIPLAWITLGVDYLIWGMNPMGYHLTSVLLHAGTAIALYFVALRLLGIATGRTGDWTTALGAAVTALVFAVHPLRVESVAWATERRDVLSGLFYVLTVLAWLRHVEAGRSRRWYWAAVVLFACAVFSKALAVTLVAALLVLDVYPLRRLGGEAGWWSRAARGVYAEKLPFVLLAAAGSVMAFGGLMNLGNMAPLRGLGIAERLTISVFGLVFYLWKTVVPIDLSPLYQLPAVVNPPDYTLSFIAVGAITVLAVLERRRAPWFAAAWMVYVVTLLPVLGLFQNGPQIAADRYTYLASIPWALVLGGAVGALWRWLRRRGKEAQLAAAIVALPLVIALELATVNQIGIWRDGVSLWGHAVRVDPSSAFAFNNLGAAWLEADRVEEAEAALERAVELLPGLPWHGRANVLQALGLVRQHRGNLQSAEDLYRRALSVDPAHRTAWNHLGTALAEQGRTEEALQAFVKALAVAPDNAEACANGRHAALLLKKELLELSQCSPTNRS